MFEYYFTELHERLYDDCDHMWLSIVTKQENNLHHVTKVGEDELLHAIFLACFHMCAM